MSTTKLKRKKYVVGIKDEETDALLYLDISAFSPAKAELIVARLFPSAPPHRIKAYGSREVRGDTQWPEAVAVLTRYDSMMLAKVSVDLIASDLAGERGDTLESITDNHIIEWYTEVVASK